MNKFFNYIQPTIVKTTDNEEIPENLRNRYFVNFNVFGIDYFLEHFILTENEAGSPYLLLKEDKWVFELEEIIGDGSTVLDAPRLYIDITDKFVNEDGTLFQSFVMQSLAQNTIWAVGIDGFLAGQEYYVNYTLYNFIANTYPDVESNFSSRLPNYLNKEGKLQTQYWQDLSNETYKDYSNIEYFNWMNNLLTNTFTKEELDNFYGNFCQIILEYTKIDDSLRILTQNQIYDTVLNYYANYKSDDTSTALNLILGSLYSTSTSSSCSCNSESASTTTTSCADLYSQAMPLYLQKMLADKDFYNDWFTILVSDTNIRIPNEALIEKLRLYINEFISLGYDLSLTSAKNSNCNCPTISSSASECNYNIIKNYLNVLDYVNNEAIDANINKIKVFGTQFATILPQLQF